MVLPAARPPGLQHVLRAAHAVVLEAVDVTRGGVPLGGLKPGDVFGEMSIVRNARTAATVVPTRPSTVLFLAREYVSRIVAGVPEIKSYLEALAEDREIDNQLLLGEDETPADERILI